MHRSLVRWKFVNRTWGAGDLSAIAKFWLRLYDEAEHLPHKSGESHQTLEIRLTGFPRSAVASTSTELVRRLRAAGMPVDVSTVGPDTLIAKTKPRDGNRAPFPGFGVRALAGSPFDGTLVEIHYTVADAGATEDALGLVGAMLVIVGELQGGAVAVKSIWVEPAFVRVDRFWEDLPEWEVHILAAFDRYRSHNEVSREFARTLFNSLIQRGPSGLSAVLLQFGHRLWDVPFGRPRLGGLLRRWVTLAVTIVVWVSLFAIVPLGKDEDRWLMVLMLLALPWLYFAYEFIRLERARLDTMRTQRREWFDEYFRTPNRYAALAPSDPRPWLNDPIVRKLTAEVLEAGFVHAGDAAAVPLDSAGTVHRVFLAPDGFTYLVLAFTYTNGSGAARSHNWPASLSILCQTFNYNDCRFETQNHEPPLGVLNRRDPTGRWMVVPLLTHPLELFRAHVEAVERWLIEVGIALLPHEPFDRYIARQDEISRQERKVYHANPYSRRDHLRWYLQLDARPSDDSK